MRILIVKLGAIGDVIRTTSVLPGLKERYKDCQIDWITKNTSFDILKNNNIIDHIFSIDDDVEKLKTGEYDWVISLDDENEACEIASLVKSRKITGAYLKHNTKVYSEDSKLWFDMGLISRFGKKRADEMKAENTLTYQEIMYRILDLDYRKQEPVLILTEKDIEFQKKFAEENKIKQNDIVIGINTGAGGRWEDKKLSIEQTAELIDMLNNSINCKIILFGGPEEEERNKKIISLAKTNIIDAGCKNSLMEFSSLVDLCKILVTSDSLALHIGTSLKKNIVVFFYPTSAAEIETYNRGVKIVWGGRSYCSYQPKCDAPPKIELEKIIRAVKKFI